MGNEWAQEYILDPLTAPEPNQETGPGTSHVINQFRASSSSMGQSRSPKISPSPPIVQEKKSQSSTVQVTPAAEASTAKYPTPPTSVSPSKSTFHSSNPFKSTSLLDTHDEEFSSPQSPPGKQHSPLIPYRGPRSPPVSGHRRSASARIANPPVWETAEGGIQRSSSTRTNNSLSSEQARLRQRYPGDMSHRPLDVIKRETRTAERRHKPKQLSETDIIDSLDTIGGAYHHGGPYDATLASRNIKKKYSPVAAVEATNREALRATPQEFIDDSLKSHLPLQGTSLIPNGGTDIRGNVMRYNEGADLMREADAPGGAYKRWDGITYLPDDLKGKGEPSYTHEKDYKKKDREMPGGPNEIEMRSGVNGHRERRASNEPTATSSGNFYHESESGIQRSNTTGKRVSEGIKRRFGSLRKNKETTAAAVH